MADDLTEAFKVGKVGGRAGSGWTAVHQAASRGNARILKAVIEAVGDFGRPDHDG
jgi:hypothetical protein